MGIASFIAKAKDTSVSREIIPLEDVSTEDFTKTLESMDNTTTSRSITDQQYKDLKELIAGYRVEIMKGTFTPSEQKLHAICMWYRVTREEAFIVIKEKVKKERAPSKTGTRVKKPQTVIGELM